MLRSVYALVPATLLTLSGCALKAPSTAPSGTTSWGQRYSRRDSPGPAAEEPAPGAPVKKAYRPGGGSFGGATPPPAPRARPYHRRSSTALRHHGHTYQPRPTYRPGLGTVFGHRVSSSVRYVSFRRASTRPTAQAMIHYNDRQGLVAMVRHLKERCCQVLPAYRVRPDITFQLVDRFGSPLPGAQLQGRTIVMGSVGRRYAILVRNLSGKRYEIVASVDGLDVIDGRRASVHKRGYILPPLGRVLIKGFRTSAYQVAAFTFGSVRNSYAARTSGDRHVGVVGLAVFAELRPRWSRAEIEKRLTAQPFGDSGYAAPPPP